VVYVVPEIPTLTANGGGLINLNNFTEKQELD